MASTRATSYFTVQKTMKDLFTTINNEGVDPTTLERDELIERYNELYPSHIVSDEFFDRAIEYSSRQFSSHSDVSDTEHDAVTKSQPKPLRQPAPRSSLTQSQSATTTSTVPASPQAQPSKRVERASRLAAAVASTPTRTATRRSASPRRATTPKPAVEVRQCTLVGLNVEYDIDISYPFDVSVAPDPDFPQQPTLDGTADSENEFLSLVLDNDTVQEYSNRRDMFADHVTSMYEKYRITSVASNSKRKAPTPTQEFTFVKGSYKPPAYEDPEHPKRTPKSLTRAASTAPKRVIPTSIKYRDENGKLAVLDDLNDAQPMIDYHCRQLDFERQWKVVLKRYIKNHPDWYLDYLSLTYISTPSVIDFKTIEDAGVIVEDWSSPITNSVYVDGIIDVNNLLNKRDRLPDIIDYMEMMGCARDFTPAKPEKTMIDIYDHRSGVLTHQKCDDAFKRSHWLQALANVRSIVNGNDEENRIFTAWERVLSSRYAYYVMMYDVKGSDLFESAIRLLLKHRVTRKMMLGALYPISFLCTPYMLGHPAMLQTLGLINVTPKKYADVLADMFDELGDPVKNICDYASCNWLTYAVGNRTVTRNETIAVLSQALREAMEKDEKSGGEKDTVEKEEEEE